MAGQNTPSDLFFNVVGVRFRVDLNGVGGLRLYPGDQVPGRNDKGVITAGIGPRGVIAAGHRGPEQRTGIIVRAVNVNNRIARR